MALSAIEVDIKTPNPADACDACDSCDSCGVQTQAQDTAPSASESATFWCYRQEGGGMCFMASLRRPPVAADASTSRSESRLQLLALWSEHVVWIAENAMSADASKGHDDQSAQQGYCLPISPLAWQTKLRERFGVDWKREKVRGECSSDAEKQLLLHAQLLLSSARAADAEFVIQEAGIVKKTPEQKDQVVVDLQQHQVLGKFPDYTRKPTEAESQPPSANGCGWNPEDRDEWFGASPSSTDGGEAVSSWSSYLYCTIL